MNLRLTEKALLIFAFILAIRYLFTPRKPEITDLDEYFGDFGGIDYPVLSGKRIGELEYKCAFCDIPYPQPSEDDEDNTFFEKTKSWVMLTFGDQDKVPLIACEPMHMELLLMQGRSR
jgi:hypothetical protein